MSYNLPEEIGQFIKNIYGVNHLNYVFDKNINTGILALKPIESMSKEDNIEFHSIFNCSPTITKETAKFLISKGYDCFGFIKKGWVCNYSIYKEKGYNESMRLRDKFLLKYERELRGEEEKIGLKEDTQTSLTERKSWMQLFKEEESEPISNVSFSYNEFITTYFINDYGKFAGILCVDTNGELIYESKFYYRIFKNNIYLYKYDNTEGKKWNYDTKYSKQ
jgi:hypothetical protein